MLAERFNPSRQNALVCRDGCAFLVRRPIRLRSGLSSAACSLAEPRSEAVATVGTVPLNDPPDLADQREAAEPLT
jgi:hypothetical protein